CPDGGFAFPLSLASGELALLLLDHRLRQAGVGVDRLGLAGGDLALALVEEGRAAQPVLERGRRVGRRRPAMGALDPALARTAVRAVVRRLVARPGIVPAKRRSLRC